MNPRLFPSLLVGFDVIGEVGIRYRIEARDELDASEWQSLSELMLHTSPQMFLDLDSSSRSRRVYRANAIGP